MKKLYLIQNGDCCNPKEAYIFACEEEAKNFLESLNDGVEPNTGDFEYRGEWSPFNLLQRARTNLEFNSLVSQLFEFLEEEEVLNLIDETMCLSALTTLFKSSKGN